MSRTIHRFPVLLAACLVAACPVAAVLTSVAAAKGQQEVPAESPPTQVDPQGIPQDNELSDEAASALQDIKDQLLKTLEQLVPDGIDDDAAIRQGMQEAIELLIDNQTEAAKEKLIQLHQANNRLPPGEYMLAALLLTAQAREPAIQMLELSAREHPDFPGNYIGFARIALGERRITDAWALIQVADDKMQSGDWSEKQVETFRFDILGSRGQIQMARQQFQQALATFQEMLDLKPENAMALANCAQSSFELGNYDQAYDYLQQTKSISDEVNVPELIMSEWFMNKQKTDASRQWMEQAIEAHPEDGRVRLEYAQWLMKNDELAKAQMAAKEAGDLGSDPYLTTLVQGQIAFAQRSYDLAEYHFSELNQARPGDLNVSNLLALSLIESEDPAKREKAMQLALMNARAYPQETTVLSTLGWVYFKNKEIQKCQEVFRQVASQRPFAPAQAYFLASFLVVRNDLQNARQLLENSLEPGSFFIYKNAARELLDRVDAMLDDESPGDSSGDSPADSPEPLPNPGDESSGG